MIEAYVALFVMFALPWVGFVAIWIDDARKAAKKRAEEARAALAEQDAAAEARRRGTFVELR